MYSAYWCPHCHEQKEDFSDSPLTSGSLKPADGASPDGTKKKPGISLHLTKKPVIAKQVEEGEDDRILDADSIDWDEAESLEDDEFEE